MLTGLYRPCAVQALFSSGASGGRIAVMHGYDGADVTSSAMIKILTV